MSKDWPRSPEFWKWYLKEHLKTKESVTIPWNDLYEAEPVRDPATASPELFNAIGRVTAAKESGSKPEKEDVQTVQAYFGYQNPLLQFVHDYNRHNDESDEGQLWAEETLTKLTHAESLEDLQQLSIRDWYVCAKLLQNNMPVPRKIIGELLEKIITDTEHTKAYIPALGMKKPERGRPSNPTKRERRLRYIEFWHRRLVEKEGMTSTEAYAVIGENECKDASTIRRDLERYAIEKERWKREILVRQEEGKKKIARLLEEFEEYQISAGRKQKN